MILDSSIHKVKMAANNSCSDMSMFEGIHLQNFLLVFFFNWFNAWVAMNSRFNFLVTLHEKYSIKNFSP